MANPTTAQGLVMPDENTKYPLQFSTYSLLSPLYLSQQQQQQHASRNAAPTANVFVNNAKILATHLIPIDADNYQTLHIIDRVLEFAYVNRRAQLRSPGVSAGGAAGSSAGAQVRKATVKRSFSLDDLTASGADQSPAFEFYERFADIQAGQPQVDLYHERVYRASHQQRVSLSKDQFNLEHLGRALRQHPQLRARLYNVNETNSLNTYFLPVNSDELQALLDNANSALNVNSLAWEAHVIPDQVLFTRAMSLGVAHATLFDKDSTTHRVSLSLVKTLPAEVAPEVYAAPEEETSARFLSTPLLVQSKCAPLTTGSSHLSSGGDWRSGLTNAEIVVANIPLTNGVLHLIKRPILVPEVNLLDYINDNDNQLSDVVRSVGSRSAAKSLADGAAEPIGVNRFRELLARERQMLSAFSMEPSMNKTILAPSDEAFSRLRYDLRALVQGDESLIPKHWDLSYRHDLLERLVKKHVILHQTLTSDRVLGSTQQIISDNGKLLSFSASGDDGDLVVESDASQARVLHKDLIASNGVLHVIDRVLGEELETVHSLLASIVLKYNHSLEELNMNHNELGQLIQSNIRQQQQQQQQEMISSSPAPASNAIDEPQARNLKASPELHTIARSIGQYLDELASTNRRQLQLLASSVNISYQLARLTSLADGLEDWNEKFKLAERQFTYFVPSDLAWIRLQQSQPELYKPLMYFLEHSDEQRDANYDNALVAKSSAPSSSSPRSSESSHRLRQVSNSDARAH